MTRATIRIAPGDLCKRKMEKFRNGGDAELRRETHRRQARAAETEMGIHTEQKILSSALLRGLRDLCVKVMCELQSQGGEWKTRGKNEHGELNAKTQSCAEKRREHKTSPLRFSAVSALSALKC